MEKANFSFLLHEYYAKRHCPPEEFPSEKEDYEYEYFCPRKDVNRTEPGFDIESCMEIASKFTLPTTEELEEEARQPHSRIACTLSDRITNNFKVLSVFELLMLKKEARESYVNQFRMDLASYFMYDEFMVGALLEMLGIMECRRFFLTVKMQPDTCIRTNTLKIKRQELQRALSRNFVDCEPKFSWSDVALVVHDSEFRLSMTTKYMDGFYTIQRASSFLPVMALDPQKDEEIIEMWASHGERTAYAAALMENTGHIYANVRNESSMDILSKNLKRMRVTNTSVFNCDVTEEANFLKMKLVTKLVNRVLLHAPSSNTGIIASVVCKKTSKQDIQKCTILQKKLLCAAIEMVKPGGYIVYSTSSIMVEENEAVIDYIIKKNKDVTLVPTDLSFGRAGFTRYRDDHFDPSLRMTMRFYPHLHDIDGLFVAKLKKISNS